ncbi:MAG: O-antigen ligase family protein [Bacteroidales bacterium]|jgi:hypothetical protein|nr:O-antigen ligase family protein [Bacteroidales bacterium]
MWFLDKKINTSIYFGILIFSSLLLVWGNLFVTLSSYFLLSFWILEGNYKEKFNRLFSSVTPIAFLMIYAVILAWSAIQIPEKDAFKEIWQNAPLLVYALVIGSREKLTHIQFRSVVLVFLFSITTNTLFNFVQFHLFQSDYTDIRNISFFMSYIRIALYTLMGIAICAYYLFFSRTKHFTQKQNNILIACLLWLIFFIFYVGSITGYIIFITLLVVSAFSYTLQHKKAHIQVISFSIIVFLFAYITVILYEEITLFTNPDTIEVAELDSVTLLDNPYQKFSANGIIENGHWVNLYICKKELFDSWHKYSSISLKSYDKKKQPIKSTLIRYMTSKNLRKDASGLKQLTKTDISHIENGLTNYRFAQNYNLRNRIYETVWEFHTYLQGNSPAGHSVTQRFEFVKCAIEVIKKYPVWGTGPAYVVSELHTQYPQQDIRLPKQYWHKPHNQFVLFLLQYGIVGFIIITASLLIIFYKGFQSKKTLAISWTVIVVISFLNEDMLDTINGLVFFAFFGCLFLCSRPHSSQKLT